MFLDSRFWSKMFVFSCCIYFCWHVQRVPATFAKTESLIFHFCFRRFLSKIAAQHDGIVSIHHQNHCFKMLTQIALKMYSRSLYHWGVWKSSVSSAPKSVFASAWARVIIRRSEITQHFHRKIIVFAQVSKNEHGPCLRKICLWYTADAADQR